MSLLIQYLVKLSISLAIVWLFYQFVLRRLTFYNSNRWYLLGYTLISFFIPFINISPVLEQNHATGNGIVQLIPSVYQYTIVFEEATACPIPIWSTNYDKWHWMAFGLLVGAGIFFLRFVIRCISFFNMKRKAKLISEDGVRLYQVEDSIIPFSFGNSVFINSELHTEAELSEIISHEFVHVKQRHTLDIIWSEWLCIINWYNPFAWLLKRSIRQNLEFIADNKVLENGVNKKQYQYLLLKVIGNNQYSIASKFNFSSLKKRIAMMNKLKTARVHLVKFLFVLPLLSIVLISFRKQIGGVWEETQKVERTDTVPSQNWNPVPTESEKDFLRRHPRVERIGWGYLRSVVSDNAGIGDKFGKPGDMFMTIFFKNGKWDSYNLGKPSDVEKFKKNYGEAPPTPPAAPTSFEPELNSKGNYVSIVDNNGECMVVIRDRDQKEIKRMPLSEWNEDPEQYEELYGEIPPPAPPVAPVPPLPPVAAGIPVPANAPVAAVAPVEAAEPAPGMPAIAPVEPAAPAAPVAPVPTTIDCETADPSVTKANKENRSKVRDYDITETKATMYLKNGEKEEYDLRKSSDMKKFESKYGKIIRVGSDAPVPYAVITSGSGQSQTVVAPFRHDMGDDVIVIGNNGATINGKEDILITITKNTTPQQLDEMKRQLKEKGVELVIEDTEYKGGQLVSITGKMKSKQGQSNFVATDFNQLTVSVVVHADRTYFKVTTDEGRVVI